MTNTIIVLRDDVNFRKPYMELIKIYYLVGNAKQKNHQYDVFSYFVKVLIYVQPGFVIRNRNEDIKHNKTGTYGLKS